MSPTPTERRIIESRKTAKSGALLIPILEKLYENEVIPEDEEDFAFMAMLIKARAAKRQKGVFSPSQLGTCTRQAWFGKRGEEKHLIESPRANGYFATGNFTHFKWQFSLWKAHRAGLLELVKVPSDYDLAWPDSTLGDLWRWAVEVRVVDGDVGGTIDAIVRLPTFKEPFTVDFKGINLIDFQRTITKGAPIAYQRQLVGYTKLANKKLKLGMLEGLLVCECKAGPMAGKNPLALHETRVPLETYVGDVDRRLRTLRWYDARDEMPDIECVSTKHMQYQECPFSRFCHEEVLGKQHALEARASKSRGPLKVARPQR
jgi:hypothetical protein